MKKLSLIVLLFSIVILSGCGRNIPENISNYSANSGEISVVENKDIPTCVPEKLADVEILNMDNLVKNCTSKEKEGRYLDGLGGICGDFELYNNELLTPTYSEETPIDEIFCKSNDGVEYMKYEYVPLNKDTPGLNLFTKVAGKGLVKNIAANCYPDKIYCNENDSDCMDMIDYGGREEGKNYFLAGSRGEVDYRNYKMVYIINDKVYSPGESNPAGGIMKDSKRNFAGIKDNKIIVKRIKGGQLKGTPNLDDPTLDLTTVKSIFTLETCEIDL